MPMLHVQQQNLLLLLLLLLHGGGNERRPRSAFVRAAHLQVPPLLRQVLLGRGSGAAGHAGWLDKGVVGRAVDAVRQQVGHVDLRGSRQEHGVGGVGPLVWQRLIVRATPITTAAATAAAGIAAAGKVGAAASAAAAAAAAAATATATAAAAAAAATQCWGRGGARLDPGVAAHTGQPTRDRASVRMLSDAPTRSQ